MVRRCFAILVVILALALAGAAAARRRHQIDATPFSHAPCSVLEGRPCTPSFCSVFNHGPCIPEIDYPYGENLQLTVQTLPPKDEAAKYVRPDHDLDTIGDLFAELRSCPSRAAGRCGARGDADVGAFQLQAVWRDHRRTALDLRHRGGFAGHPRNLPEGDQRLARWLRAAEIHRRPGWRACRAPDRDPLCRQSRIGPADEMASASAILPPERPRHRASPVLPPAPARPLPCV